MKPSDETDEEKEPSNDEDDEVKDKITHLAEKITRAWMKREEKGNS